MPRANGMYPTRAFIFSFLALSDRSIIPASHTIYTPFRHFFHKCIYLIMRGQAYINNDENERREYAPPRVLHTARKLIHPAGSAEDSGGNEHTRLNDRVDEGERTRGKIVRSRAVR